MTEINHTSTQTAGSGFVKRALLARAFLGRFAIVLGAYGLVANGPATEQFLSQFGIHMAMHPIAALCLCFLGFALILPQKATAEIGTRQILLLFVLLVSMARVLESLVLGDLAPETARLFEGNGLFNRHPFDLNTALVLSAISLSALMPRENTDLALAGLAIAFLPLLHSLLEISYGLRGSSGDSSIFTLLGLLCVAGALATHHMRQPPIRVVLQAGASGSLTRTLAGAAIMLLWLGGFFFLRTTELGFDLDQKVAMGLAMIIWSMFLILLITLARAAMAELARQHAAWKLEVLGTTDLLTNAVNRPGLTKALETAWLSFKDGRIKFGIILIDLDHFNTINETFGLEAGDEVLARITDVLRPHLRASDILGRWGGEKFMIILQVQDRKNLGVIAERLREVFNSLDSPYLRNAEGSLPWRISASFGVSEMLQSDRGPFDSVSRADEGLMLAKERGRNRVEANYIGRAA